MWCGIVDLNHHGVTHTALNRTRLPIPPIPRINTQYDSTMSVVCKVKNENLFGNIFSIFFDSDKLEKHDQSENAKS